MIACAAAEYPLTFYRACNGSVANLLQEESWTKENFRLVRSMY